MVGIEIQTKIYKNTDHPDVAITLANIAQQWNLMGDYQKALQQFEKVLGKNNVSHTNPEKANCLKRAKVSRDEIF